MSGKIGIIVQARMSSSRLPGKSLKKIGREPLIYYILERLKQLDLPVIVCTSTHFTDDVLAAYLKLNNYDYFRGSLDNVLERYILAAEAFGIDQIVRVTGDNPLVDIQYLKKSLQLFNNYNYVDGIYPEGLIKGTGFELVRLSELKSIPSQDQQHQEHVSLWLREHLVESKKRIQLIPTDINKYRSDIFLSCDYPEDFRLLEQVYAHFAYNPFLELEEVIGFLDQNPEIKVLNSFLH